MKSYILLFFICFFKFVSVSFSQTTVGLPVQFIQFFKNYALVNPASPGSDSSININIGNKSLTGAFSGVRTYYIYGNLPLKPFVEGKSNHVIGANFINDREGSFINRNRASLLYSLRIPLNSTLSINAGVAAGFINYSFDASNIQAGGSVFVPNADIGLWLHSADFNIGISGNQLFPTQLRPIDQTYTIIKHYNITADKTFQLGPFNSIRPAVLFKWQDKDNYTIDAALIALIQNTVSVAVSFRHPKGGALSAGLENIKVGSNKIKMMFSYYSPLSGNAYYNPQSFEISLNFHSF